MRSSVPPTQQVILASLNCPKFTKVDDLLWELEGACEAHGIMLEQHCGCDIVTKDRRTFNAATLAAYGLITRDWSEHEFEVEQESDSGKYNAARFMKNLRTVIAMLNSGLPLFEDAPCGGCDYCEELA